MAYQSGTASSMNDLMSVLSTFCVANGWTQDQYQAASGTGTHGKLSLHKGTVYVHYQWNPNITSSIGVYQSLGFIDSSTNIWRHTDDSGTGPSSTPSVAWDGSSFHYFNTISKIGDGPYTSYAFFQGDDYVHVALEYAPGSYRHFGFGMLEKFWDWTGGAYVYGHCQWVSIASANNALLLGSGYPATTSSKCRATINVEGLPGQGVGSKWGGFMPQRTTFDTTDRAGYNLRIMWGGAPGGPIGSVFNNKPSNSGDGFLPMSANAVFYRNITPEPDEVYFMGFQPDVRTLNMKNYNPKDEISVAGDTWVIFPAVRKQFLNVSAESRNLGIAYKKVV